MPRGILEREAELQALEGAAASVLAGEGRLVVVTAEAGLGKTRLLEAATRLAGERGFDTAYARAGELESELGWGVAVDLFDQLLGPLPGAQRAELLGGRATPARSVLDGAHNEPQGTRSPNVAEVISAMTLLVRRLTEQRPIAVAVDDVHWSDISSLRWLASMAARLGSVRALFVIGFRPIEPGAPIDLLADLESAADVVLKPRPLSLGATSGLVSTSLEVADARSVHEAVHDVTSGNPFLIDELLHHLNGRVVSAEAVLRARPERLRSRVLPRVRRLGSAATAVSEAVAVLGVNAGLAEAAAVAQVSIAEAVQAVEQLTAAGILSDGLPLNYAHPLLSAVVNEGLSAARADMLHRRAADVLLKKDDPDQSAVHLLASQPVGQGWAADVLADAGRRSLARAAPESAAAFYARALAEHAPSVPTHPLHLGRARALLMSGRDDGFAAFREAIAAVPDSRERAVLALEMGDALSIVDRQDEAFHAYDSSIAAIDGHDEALRIHLLAHRALASMATRGQQERTATSVAAAVEATERSPELATRAALVLPALVATMTAAPAADCIVLLERALAAEAYGERPALEWSAELGWLMASLAWSDAFDHAEPFLDAVIARAACRAALVDLAVAAIWRAYGRLRLGRLADAEADVITSARIYRDIDEADHSLVTAVHVDVLVARGRFDQAEQLLEQPRVNSDEDDMVHLALVDARARMRLAQGRLADAQRDLEVLAAAARDTGFDCPAAAPWRSGLAIVLRHQGEVDRARAVVTDDVERCRAFGAPRALGLALLGAGAVERGDAGLPALREAVDVLAGSPARLEYARALAALGSRLRRVGQRVEARDILHEALHVACECSADALVAQARAELKVLGARPRRGWQSGESSLTAAEHRVATLAAAGATNGEIAREFVVTLRTVETHLTSIYRKLDIPGRSGLVAALGRNASHAQV
jgi:DNA-binding CsgD family transcriptional regulator/tetratricopeptide (TPR) repeat protein